MTIDERPGCEYAAGVIGKHVQNNEFMIRLDDGREVIAILPKSRMRQLGFIGSLVGWRATVVFRPAPKCYVILEIQRPNSQQESK